MAGGPTIWVKLLGDASGLGKAFDGAASKGQAVAGNIHDAFGKTLSALNSTGVLGPFGDALNNVDMALGSIADHGKDLGPIFMGVGGAIAGAGALLTGLGSKDQAAHQQLDAAVAATGKGYDLFGDQVETAIKHQEKFGNTAAQTQDALRILTQATGDPAKALGLLNTATDLAAAKHESLTGAAGQLGKAYNGAGRILKEFGVEAAPKAAAANKALESATTAAAAADKGAADAKQHLMDLQARLTTGNKGEVVSTAGVLAAKERLASAQEHLSQLEAIDAGKGKLTIAQQFALQNAHEAVTKAVAGVGTAQGKYGEALDKARAKGGLSITQEQQLRNAEEKATDAAAKAKAAHDKLAGAHDTASKAAHGQQDTMDALSKKLTGQAAAAADTFGGKVKEIKAKLEDTAASIGQKYGPAITGAGTVMAGLGGVMTTVKGTMDIFKKSQEAAKDTQLAFNLAEDAGAVSAWAALGPILLIIAAIAALVAIGYVIYRNWDTIWKAIKLAVVVVWDWIKANWPLLLGILLGPIALAAALIYKYWDQIKAGALAVWNWVKTNWPLLLAILTGPIGLAVLAIKRNWDAIKNGATDVWNWIKGKFNDLVSFFTGIPGRISNAVGDLFGGIKGKATDAYNWVTQELGGIVTTVASLPAKIANAAAGMFHGIWAAFDSMVNGIASLWNNTVGSLSFKVPGWVPGLGGKGFDVPDIPHLAQGGLVLTGGLAYLHPAEVVSPAPTSITNARTGPAVVIQQANFATEMDVESFMKQAAWIIQTQRI